MLTLWPHQQELYASIGSERTKEVKRILAQSATGSGKTRVLSYLGSEILRQSPKENIVYSAPRIELVDQISDTLKGFGLHHAKLNETKHFRKSTRIHVTTHDTLKILLDKAPFDNPRIIIDEAHLFNDFQNKLKKRFPESIFYGFTATPERQDSIGLHESGGGIWDSIVYGKSIPYLTAAGYLTDIQYFQPPPKLNGDIFGDSIELMLKNAPGRNGKRVKPFCAFLPSVAEAYRAAENYQAAGFNVVCIEGTLTKKQRNKIWNGLRNGTLDGITNCDLATYGIDIPCLEVVIFLRNTGSFSLYMQMVGRAIRTYHDEKTGYTKKKGIVFDMVGNIATHADYVNEWGQYIPLHWQDEIDFNFYGSKERKKKEKELFNGKIYFCGEGGKIHYQGRDKKCPVCGKDLDQRIFCCEKCNYTGKDLFCPSCGDRLDGKKPPKIVKVDLEETKKTVQVSELPLEEKREAINAIMKARTDWNIKRKDGEPCIESVTSMIKLMRSCNKKEPLWIYHQLRIGTKEPKIDDMLIREIGRQSVKANGEPYSRSWARFQIRRMGGR